MMLMGIGMSAEALAQEPELIFAFRFAENNANAGE
jgi:hypothetical protein